MWKKLNKILTNINELFLKILKKEDVTSASFRAWKGRQK